MRTRDPEAKRQQLFEAALAEFAEFGLAGARVDRLAKRAGISAGLVYSFYDGKEGLFDAVFDQIVELAVATVPIDADDLPGYAARLYDSGAEHPEVARFMTWYQLEHPRSPQRTAAASAMADKVAAIADAQRLGVVTADIPAGQILAAVLAIANMWNQPSEDLRALVPGKDRRQAVIDTVARVVTP
ncbi:MAG TPA: TetR family transcriptional regulator [Streptosporangiaceae bacterium]